MDNRSLNHFKRLLIKTQFISLDLCHAFVYSRGFMINNAANVFWQNALCTNLKIKLLLDQYLLIVR